MALVKLDQKNTLVPFVNNKAANKNQLFPLCTQDFKTVNYSSKNSDISNTILIISIFFFKNKVDKSAAKPYINFKHLEWLIDLDNSSEDKSVKKAFDKI